MSGPNLDEKIEELLLRDYESANDRVMDIIQGRNKNDRVMDADYLNPTIGNNEVPLDHLEGALQYYRNIRDCLELALTTGSIPKGKVRFRPPGYVRDLLVGKNRPVHEMLKSRIQGIENLVMDYAFEDQKGNKAESVQITIGSLQDDKVIGWFLRDIGGKYNFVFDQDLPKFKHRIYLQLAGLVVRGGGLYITNNTANNLILINSESRIEDVRPWIIPPTKEKRIFERNDQSRKYGLIHSLEKGMLELEFKGLEKPKAAFEYDELWNGLEEKLSDPRLNVNFGALISPRKEIPWDRFTTTLAYFEAKEKQKKPTTPYLREFMGKLWGIPGERLEKLSLRDLVKGYIASYIRAPIATIQNENRILTENTKLPLNWLVNFLVGFHRDIDTTLFQTDDSHVSKNPERFEELNNIWYLASGDYLPGSKFVLGEVETYNRELLRLEAESPLVYESLVQSKLTAISYARQGKLSLEKTSKQIFIDFQKLYSDRQDGKVLIAKTVQAGDYMEDGGCCRHRSASLAQAYQEAGLFAQYFRSISRFGKHASVLIYEAPDKVPAINLDPNMPNSQFEKQGLNRGTFYAIPKDMDGYSSQKLKNTIWRAKVK